MMPAAVGIDIGGTKLQAVRVEGERVVADPARHSPVDGAAVVAVVAAAGERLGPAAAIGVGVPGLVDADGVVQFAPNLPGLVGTSLRQEIAAAFPGGGVWIGNDATAACWAEYARGAGRGASDALVVTLGTGIGGGMVCGGTLVEGAHRYAGEFGHMVVDPDGPKCPCGKQGCWERFASGSGLGALGREMALAGEAPNVVAAAGGDAEAVRGEHVTRAAAEGDGPAIEIMRRFGWWVGLGLANLATVFDPEVIVLGGGLIEAGEVLMEPTRRAFSELLAGASVRPPVRIEAAVLGARAGAIGAALLAAAQH